MKDFLKRDIEVGDAVVFIHPMYRELTLGTVIKETPKQLTIEYKSVTDTKKTTNRYPSTLVRVEGPDLTKFLLS